MTDGGGSRGLFERAEPLVADWPGSTSRPPRTTCARSWKPRAVSGPFLVADPDRSGSLAGTRSQQAPGHPGTTLRTLKMAESVHVWGIRRASASLD